MKKKADCKRKSSILTLVDKVAQKLQLSNRQIASKLTFYVLMVMSGLKDAYLVDVCCLTKYLARILIDTIAVEMKMNTTALSVIMIGEDCFIVHNKILMDKIDQLTTYSDHSDRIISFPSIIELDSNDLMLKSSLLECPFLVDGLIALFSGVDTIDRELCSSGACAVFSQLGAPFIGGFLLGYPIIYHARCRDCGFVDGGGQYDVASSKLSFTILRKIVISIVGHKLQESNIFGNYFEGEISIPVLEFTYPEILSTAFDVNLESVIQRKFASMETVVMNYRSPLDRLFRDMHIFYSSFSIETQSIAL